MTLKIYDSLDPAVLIEEVLLSGCSPVVMAMAMDVHRAVRTLRVGKAYGDFIVPICSILAGCGTSNTWARVGTYRFLNRICNNFGIQLSQFVDDIGHQTFAKGHEGDFIQKLSAEALSPKRCRPAVRGRG